MICTYWHTALFIKIELVSHPTVVFPSKGTRSPPPHHKINSTIQVAVTGRVRLPDERVSEGSAFPPGNIVFTSYPRQDRAET